MSLFQVYSTIGSHSCIHSNGSRTNLWYDYDDCITMRAPRWRRLKRHEQQMLNHSPSWQRSERIASYHTKCTRLNRWDVEKLLLRIYFHKFRIETSCRWIRNQNAKRCFDAVRVDGATSATATQSGQKWDKIVSFRILRRFSKSRRTFCC